MTVKKFPTPGIYIFFQKYGKSAHAAQWAKSRVLTKMIDTILDIDFFKKQCVILKGLLHS